MLLAAVRSNCGKSFIHLAMCRLRNHYEVLGVKKTAERNQIRRAYYELAKKYHPDVNGEPDAARKFLELAKAYEVLNSPKRRANYDRMSTTEQRSYNVDPREQAAQEEKWEQVRRYASSSPYSRQRAQQKEENWDLALDLLTYLTSFIIGAGIVYFSFRLYDDYEQWQLEERRQKQWARRPQQGWRI